MGEGKSGIIAKTDEAIAAFSAELKKIIRRDKEKERITRLTFDLFDFSRGAASAHHSANSPASRGNGSEAANRRSPSAMMTCASQAATCIFQPAGVPSRNRLSGVMADG